MIFKVAYAVVLAWRARLRHLIDYLFGYDFFISYAWADGSEYAKMLWCRLQSMGLVCFLDSNDFQAGDNFKRTSRYVLRRTTCLAVVVTKGALASEAVKDELRAFSSRSKHIVPIDMGNTYYLAGKGTFLSRYLADEILRLSEPADCKAPSDDVVQRLYKYVAHERRARRRLRVAAAISISMLILSCCLAALSYVANRQYHRAEEESANAKVASIRAQTEAISSDNERRLAQAAEQRAQHSSRIAKEEARQKRVALAEHLADNALTLLGSKRYGQAAISLAKARESDQSRLVSLASMLGNPSRVSFAGDLKGDYTCMAPASNCLFVGTRRGDVLQIDSSSARIVRSWRVCDTKIEALGVDDAGRYVAVCLRYGLTRCYLLDTVDGVVVAQLSSKNLGMNALSVSFGSNSKKIAVAGGGGVLLGDFDGSNELNRVVEVPTDFITSDRRGEFYFASGNTIAHMTSEGKPSVLLPEPTSFQETKLLGGAIRLVATKHFSCSTSGKTILSTLPQDHVEILHLERKTKLPGPRHDSPIRFAVFCGELAICLDSSGEASLFHADDGRLLERWSATGNYPVSAVTIANSILATMEYGDGEARTIAFWKILQSNADLVATTTDFSVVQSPKYGVVVIENSQEGVRIGWSGGEKLLKISRNPSGMRELAAELGIDAFMPVGIQTSVECTDKMWRFKIGDAVKVALPAEGPFIPKSWAVSPDNSIGAAIGVKEERRTGSDGGESYLHVQSEVIVIDIAQSRVVGRFRPTEDLVLFHPRFSPDGRHLLFSCDCGWLWTWTVGEASPQRHELISDRLGVPVSFFWGGNSHVIGPAVESVSVTNVATGVVREFGEGSSLLGPWKFADLICNDSVIICTRGLGDTVETIAYDFQTRLPLARLECMFTRASRWGGEIYVAWPIGSSRWTIRFVGISENATLDTLNQRYRRR